MQTKRLNLSKRDCARYSFSRAVALVASPQNPQIEKDCGFEKDLSDQLIQMRNIETKGVIVPQEVLMHRYENPIGLPRAGHILTRAALNRTTNNQGGYLVEEELGSLIEALFTNTLALQNIPTFDAIGSPVKIPGLATVPQAGWAAETGNASQAGTAQRKANDTATLTAGEWALQGTPADEIHIKPQAAAVTLLTEYWKSGTKIQMGTPADTNPPVIYELISDISIDSGVFKATILADSGTVPTVDANAHPLYILGTVPTSDATFSIVNFTQKYLRTLLKVSRTLLNQASIQIDNFIRNDIVVGLSTELDAKMLLGTGTNYEPKGIKNITGINTITYNASDLETNVLQAQAAIGRSNHPMNNLKWIISWELSEKLKQAHKLGEYADMPLLDEATMTMHGIPVEVTSQLTGTVGFLGDWMDAALCIWDDLMIEADDKTLLHQGIIRYVASMVLDMNGLRPKSFTYVG